MFNLNFSILFSGTGASLWSEESIAWLKCKVSGAKLRAYPTRVQCSKLVIIDLFVFPPKNPKTKSPVSSAGKGLPGLQFSIAEMMTFAGMAQRIMPQVNEGTGCSSGSSPVSGGSNASLSRSCSSVSIESSVQDGTACVNSCDALSSKDESSFTENSCSSKETVIQRTEKREENSTINNEHSVLETKPSTAVTFTEESVVANKTDSVPLTASEPNIEREKYEDSKGQQDVLVSGKL